MPRDWKRFPELRNSELDVYYFESPHKQIFEDFRAKVVKVHDGDTVTLRWVERNFDFPLRLLNIAAPELNEKGGKESQSWLENEILNEEVDVIMDSSHRVEKWGRLLGKIEHKGIDMGEMSIINGHAISWEQRGDGKIPDWTRELDKSW